MHLQRRGDETCSASASTGIAFDSTARDHRRARAARRLRLTRASAARAASGMSMPPASASRRVEQSSRRRRRREARRGRAAACRIARARERIAPRRQLGSGQPVLERCWPRLRPARKSEIGRELVSAARAHAGARRGARTASRGSGRRTKGGFATSPIGIGSCRGAPTCVILIPHEPHGPRGTPRQFRCSADGLGSGAAIFALAGDQFPQPFAVMPPGPAAGDPAAGHGADRAAHPDRRVDVHDPDADDRSPPRAQWTSTATRFCSIVV